ncbi:MAG: transglycosylase SLT domain-containing protein [Dysgonamonadaceae bacterium]|jgi:membrane-bound lytic murein transglycosylase D|nr:transglycosylase SLT domain-containing protein [Dysgonamonadaceae bacterium]
MKQPFLVFVLLWGTLGVSGQDIQDVQEVREIREVRDLSLNNFEDVDSPASVDEAFFVPESWDANLDSLINSQHVKYYMDKNAHPAYDEAVVASDSVYVDRLSRLNNVIELPYNKIVRNCIDLYVDRRRNMVEYMLGLENFYFPMIEQALDENGLPLELKYLAVIESALNPVALSRVGASGLWQFMLTTGKQYGLEINSLVDERRDPVKATYAACEYFKDMYRIYGDWTLVIAAYNCGSGNVNKAIRRAGSADYWKIYPYLPRETRLYVPLFIAATYVMNYHANHHLRPVQTSLPVAVDTVMVANRAIHFDQVAEILNVDKELIRILNPQYKRDIIPGNSKPRVLKLPALQAYAFVEKEDTIVNHRKEELFANRVYAGYSANHKEKIIHRVKQGETVVSIGNKYGVTAASIRKWNKLKSNRVGAGRNIVVYADNGGYIAQSSPASSTAGVKPAAKTAALTASAGRTTSSLNRYNTYKVRSGDTLYSIAQKYPGYSSGDLKKINNLKNSNLRIGQIIKVPKG